MPNKIDLTGQEFNLIRCLSPAPSKNGKTYWNCECIKCGQKKTIQTCHIKNGATKTCGCNCSDKELKIGKSKICPICDKEFTITETKDNSRKYCYECSPPDRRGDYTPLFNAMKKRLIELKGGCCQRCGYNKNIVALCFHHRNPTEKTFEINMSSHHCTWEEIFEESKKCDLLCLNCHAEIHNELNHIY
jgi:hypothetical protein